MVCWIYGLHHPRCWRSPAPRPEPRHRPVHLRPRSSSPADNPPCPHGVLPSLRQPAPLGRACVLVELLQVIGVVALRAAPGGSHRWHLLTCSPGVTNAGCGRWPACTIYSLRKSKSAAPSREARVVWRLLEVSPRSMPASPVYGTVPIGPVPAMPKVSYKRMGDFGKRSPFRWPG